MRQCVSKYFMLCVNARIKHHCCGWYRCFDKLHEVILNSLLLSFSVPTPRVHITRTPSTGVYTTTRLKLTCITVLRRGVDTPVTVTHTWRGPSGSISRYSSRPRVSNITQVGQVYRSSIIFSSGMRASDSGSYSCTSSTSSASPYIVTSGSVAASTSITVGKEDGYNDYIPRCNINCQFSRICIKAWLKCKLVYFLGHFLQLSVL